MFQCGFNSLVMHADDSVAVGFLKVTKVTKMI